MALFLDIGTIRPDVVNESYKYSIRSPNRTEGAKRDEAFRQDPKRTKLHKNLQQNIYEGNSEALYGAVSELYRNNFRDLLTRTEDKQAANDTASCTGRPSKMCSITKILG